MTENRRGFDRRTALRAGAWTAPAIVAISAAPAFAASGDPALPVSLNFNAPPTINGYGSNPMYGLVYPHYDPQGAGSTEAPATATVTAFVTVNGPGVSNQTATLSPVGPYTINKWGQVMVNYTLAGAFETGQTYTVTATLTAVGFSGSASKSATYVWQ